MNRSPDNPEVIFLHGFMGCGGDWEPVREALGGGFECHAPDLPGHGAAIGLPAEAYAFDGMVARVAALCGGLNGRPRVVAGYSMGGRIALAAALQHPALFDQLILISASPGIARTAARKQRRRDDEALAARLEQISGETEFRGFLRDWWNQPVFQALPEALREDLLRRRPRGANPAELARALRGAGAGAQPCLLDRLTEFPGRMLVLAGERDAKFREIAARIAAHARDAEAHEVAGAGHMLPLEAPRAVADRITAFLAK